MNFYHGESMILGKKCLLFFSHNGMNKEDICRFRNTQHFLDGAGKEAAQTTMKNVSPKSMRMLVAYAPPTPR